MEVYEDGVKQAITSLTMIHGGREFNVLAPPTAVRDGLILPPSRPRSDTAGRIFLIVIDDLHLDFSMTPKTRQILGQMLRDLIHDGDMFGIVSTGYSSISEQLTYDRQVLESAISRVTGGGLKPREIIQGPQGSQGPTELRHRAHVAFSTAYDLMRNLEKVQNRRKAVIYISSGYDFNPFQGSRLEEQALRMHVEAADLQNDPFFRTQQSSQMLAEADLVRELAELTRAANRANATIYTIDPRGLSAGPDIDVDISVTGVECAHARVTGQPARDRRADRRFRDGEHERLQRRPEAHRRRDERLLRAGVLLEQSGSAQADPPDRSEDDAPGCDRVPPDVVYPSRS